MAAVSACIAGMTSTETYVEPGGAFRRRLPVVRELQGDGYVLGLAQRLDHELQGVLVFADDPELVAASDSVCTGLQLVNFLQDVPRDLELGRIYLPLEDRERFGSPALDGPSAELRTLLRFEAERAAALLRAGDLLRARIGGRLGRAVGLFARGGLAALDALERADWDLFTQRPKPSRARLVREAASVLVR